MSEIEAFQERFAVASSVLIDAYGDVRVRGYLKEDPELVAAALEDIKSLVRILEGPTHGEAPTFSGSAVLELINEAERFHQHTCACPWCFNGAHDSAED